MYGFGDFVFFGSEDGVKSVNMKNRCVRCLLRDLDEKEVYRKLQEYLAAFPDEMKAEQATYESRLKFCRACDALHQGICTKCGCFVEARALKKKAGCPHEIPRW